MIRVVPTLLVGAARAWDEQRHDLTTVARVLGAIDTGGFPRRVVGAAEGFVQAWQVLVAGLAGTAGARASSLRATAADWVTTDDAVGERLDRLTAWSGWPR